MKAVVYLLQVSACSAIFYLFYFLLLRKLTFFTLNRWFLLTTVLLSFLIPAISLPVDRGQPHIVIVQQAVNVNTLQFSSAEKTIARVKTAPKTFDYLLFLRVIYWIVVIGLSVQLIVTLIRFFRKLKGKQTVKSGRINIIQSQSEFPNGSFLNYIFLNGQDLSADELQQIIAHEMLHVQLAHSVDRVLIKIAQILLWFNPFIYFYAKSAEENHEFEVDRALTNATDKRSYANLLLHLSVAGGGTLYHSFSKVPLKKRIAMLFNQPSAKMKKVIYVLILPVVLISCLAFARLKKDGSAIKKESKNKKTLPQKPKNDLSLFNQNEKLYAKNSIQKGFPNDADTTKYRQKLKRTPEQIKGEADFKAWRETDDFKQKEKQAQEIQGKTITVKIKEVVDRAAGKSDLFISNAGKVKGFNVIYNNKEYFMRTNYNLKKQLNVVLKVGDDITVNVRQSTFGRNSINMIDPAFILKNNVKIYQSVETDKIPDYPFLYEANKVRFADGQISHIQKYPNGKWKSAVLEIVNGYKLNLNFKPIAPDFSNIEEGDHVRFRFVHEVKTGAKTYQVNDWVSISTNIKDYRY